MILERLRRPSEVSPRTSSYEKHLAGRLARRLRPSSVKRPSSMESSAASSDSRLLSYPEWFFSVWSRIFLDQNPGVLPTWVLLGWLDSRYQYPTVPPRGRSTRPRCNRRGE